MPRGRIAWTAALVLVAAACSSSTERSPVDGGTITDGDVSIDDGVLLLDDGGRIDGVCPGYTPPMAGAVECRTMDECPTSTMGPTYCVPTDYVPPPSCGGPAPPPSCVTDDDCAASRDGFSIRCADSPRPACTGPRACTTACTTDGECGEGERCLSTGLCEALLCPSEHTCPADYLCDAAAETADDHGCVGVSCADGYECPSGWTCDPIPDPHVIPDDHGCRPLDCFETDSCPINFRCDATPAGYMCLQIGCDRDDQCDCGACVANHCVLGPGYCFTPPPPPP